MPKISENPFMAIAGKPALINEPMPVFDVTESTQDLIKIRKCI